MQDFMTADEVAKFLRVSLCTIRRLTMLRQIPCVHVSRRVLYPVSEIEAWLERNAVTASDLAEKSAV